MREIFLPSFLPDYRHVFHLRLLLPSLSSSVLFCVAMLNVQQRRNKSKRQKRYDYLVVSLLMRHLVSSRTSASVKVGFKGPGLQILISIYASYLL